jgi:hypothetical protein
MKDEQLFEMIKVVSPLRPKEAQGEVQMESDEVEIPQIPERSGSPVIDEGELMETIEQLCGKPDPVGASDVPPGTSDHSETSENSSEKQVGPLAGETLAETAVRIADTAVEAAENSPVE